MPSSLTAAQFLQKWLPAFADNEFQNIREQTFRDVLSDLAESFATFRGLTAQRVKGGLYPVPYLDNLGLIPPDYRILNMEAVAQLGVDSAAGATGQTAPPVYFRLLSDSAGALDALLDAGAETVLTTKASWRRVSGTDAERTAAFPAFVPQNRTPRYKAGDVFQYTFAGGQTRLLEVRNNLPGAVNPTPTGAENDPNYKAFAPAPGAAPAFAALQGQPGDNAALAAALAAKSDAPALAAETAARQQGDAALQISDFKSENSYLSFQQGNRFLGVPIADVVNDDSERPLVLQLGTAQDGHWHTLSLPAKTIKYAVTNPGEIIVANTDPTNGHLHQLVLSYRQSAQRFELVSASAGNGAAHTALAVVGAGTALPAGALGVLEKKIDDNAAAIAAVPVYTAGAGIALVGGQIRNTGVRTVNGAAPDAAGNVTVAASGSELSYLNQVYYSSSYVAGNADVGKVHALDANNIAFTLPDSSANSRKLIAVRATYNKTGCQVLAPSGVTLTTPEAMGVTAITLLPGESITFLSDGTIWVVSSRVLKTAAGGAGVDANGIVTKKVSTTATSLTLEQTGDAYGGTRVELVSRYGSAGARFSAIPGTQGAGLDLVDFAFVGSSGAQKNFRFEHRGAALASSANSARGEFQILDNADKNGTPPETVSAAFGMATAVFNTDVDLSSAVRGVVMKSPNGTRYRLTVSDAGAPVFTAI